MVGPLIYTSDYWIKSIMEMEGNTIFITCTFNKNKFQLYINLYNLKNELINTETGRISMRRFVLKISNLTLSDQNLYRCVSPDSEFYTVIIVTKDWIKKKCIQFLEFFFVL